MKKFGVLVVDDSAFMRRALSQMIESDSQLYVVGIARNGLDAIDKVARLKPDIVTMDIEMPELNGIGALEQIMKTNPVPTCMISSLTKEGAAETIKALELGAADFMLKDTLLKSEIGNEVALEFLQRLKSIAETKFANKSTEVKPQISMSVKPPVMSVKKLNKSKTDLVFIGCSTGGPSALQAILPHFPKDFPIPVVVAQHMPPGFTKPLADRFNTLCHLQVNEAQNGEVLKAGTIYIEPSGKQTRFEKRADGTVVFQIDNQETPKVLYKPCVDISLASAAPIYSDRLLAIILTGMGVDGTQGCSYVKKYNGRVLVEAEESCVVYGMPKAVLEAGFADGQHLLNRMYQEIIAII
ncbi:protein-glutamate methylesterase/protein-glutamine glutaminase [Neobacillus sp. LXY-1]|uniref:protein-glutamate methylesterase/protein-glutamine glutaminase n=1 Tax=Neobacillus sp. LXY-1 TaxID=3379133 RepID=UPI003EE1C823